MAQLFTRRANTIYRGLLVLGLIVFVCFLVVLDWVPRSFLRTGHNRFIRQEVPFSHAHHAGKMQIDCRFCHNYVEKAAYAGIPQTEICMKCHSVLFKNDPMLKPVMESERMNKPLVWNRVFYLGDFVYFNHSVHIHREIACQTCHGDVKAMPWMRKSNNFFMSWCLHCHRKEQTELMLSDREPAYTNITDCAICHR